MAVGAPPWLTIAGLIVAAAGLGAAGMWGVQTWLVDTAPEPAIVSGTPGMDAVNGFRCAAGLDKTIQVRGVEDGFAPGNDEPARMRPELLQLPYFSDLQDRRVTTLRVRDFDETGSRKILLDHFLVPTDVVSGSLILRLRPRQGDTNDSYRLSREDTRASPDPLESGVFFGSRLRDTENLVTLPDGSLLLIAELTDPAAFQAGGDYTMDTVLDLINDPDTRGIIDVRIGNDTAVDFAALGLCAEPTSARGVTFTEFAGKPLGEDISFLACNEDVASPLCDPYGGDTICTQALPIACYLPGERPMPASLAVSGRASKSYVGGEIRLSPAVAGSQFGTVEAASIFCAARFGNGWRVLSYHEGGGGAVASRSTIPSRARAWVHIRDQPRANCWDRPRRPARVSAASPG
jgi:hypothetical protein